MDWVIAIAIVVAIFTASRVVRRDPAAKERAEALVAWRRYLASPLSKYGKQLHGKRIRLRYDTRYAGVREAATILMVGLQELGASTALDTEACDLSVSFKRWSPDDGLYIIANEAGEELDRNVVHHQALVSEAIAALAAQAN